MILTEEQRNEFHEAAKPMLRWINDNCHPHCHVVIDCSSASLSEGVAAIVDSTFIED